MTPSEINIKCAEFCGWRYAGGGIWEHPDGRSQKRCPCYDTDPAAMVELLSCLTRGPGFYNVVLRDEGEAGCEAQIEREDGMYGTVQAANILLALATAVAKMGGGG